jgi:predicted PurR-regulated permease PerM
MPSVFDWLITKKKALKKQRGLKFSPTAKTLSFILIIIFALFVLRYSSQIIHPFIWAVITSYLFAPLIYFLESRTRVRRVVWILLVYAIVGIIVYWAASYAFPKINMEVSELFGVGNNQEVSIMDRISDIGKTNILGVNVDLKESVIKFQMWMRSQAESFVVPVVFGLVERLIALSAYLIITFYLLLDGENYIRFFLLMFPSRYRKEITDVAGEMNETLGAYIRGQVLLIFIMSFASWMVLIGLRVHYSMVLCLTTGILEVVPIIGPIVATILASIVAFNQAHVAWGLTNLTLTLAVIFAYFILRQIEDLIVIPNVVGKFIHVHPIVVMFALFVGARVGGMLGVFLALPISALLKVLFNYLYPKLSS